MKFMKNAMFIVISVTIQDNIRWKLGISPMCLKMNAKNIIGISD